MIALERGNEDLDFLKLSNEAYQAKGFPLSFGSNGVNFLKEAVEHSDRRRSRVLMHDSPDSVLHEMFVIYRGDTFVRPNVHPNKDESILVLEGECDVVFFTESGRISNVERLGPVGGALPYFCRIPSGVFHTVLPNSPELVLFEATIGPFRPDDTFYATWSPAEGQLSQVARYLEDLRLDVSRWPKVVWSSPKRESPDAVFWSDAQIRSFGPMEEDFLKGVLDAARSEIFRARVCAHHSPADSLHEMLMIFTSDSYVQPSLHVAKAESLLIVSGLGTYYFFNEYGHVTESISLKPVGTVGEWYCRIPDNTYHSLVITSKDMIAKETAQGPFIAGDTVYASWAPSAATGETEFIRKYVRNLQGSPSV